MAEARTARRARRHVGEHNSKVNPGPEDSSRGDEHAGNGEHGEWLPAVPGDVSDAQTDAKILRYDEIPRDLADALRSVLNRYELRSGDIPKSIAVTSALPGEGVTTVAQAL